LAQSSCVPISLKIQIRPLDLSPVISRLFWDEPAFPVTAQHKRCRSSI
jgi:hypothetical protein